MSIERIALVFTIFRPMAKILEALDTKPNDKTSEFVRKLLLRIKQQKPHPLTEQSKFLRTHFPLTERLAALFPRKGQLESLRPWTVLVVDKKASTGSN